MRSNSTRYDADSAAIAPVRERTPSTQMPMRPLMMAMSSPALTTVLQNAAADGGVSKGGDMGLARTAHRVLSGSAVRRASSARCRRSGKRKRSAGMRNFCASSFGVIVTLARREDGLRPAATGQDADGVPHLGGCAVAGWR